MVQKSQGQPPFGCINCLYINWWAGFLNHQPDIFTQILPLPNTMSSQPPDFRGRQLQLRLSEGLLEDAARSLQPTLAVLQVRSKGPEDFFRLVVGGWKTTQLYGDKIISQYKDPYKPISIMESKKFFFVAQVEFFEKRKVLATPGTFTSCSFTALGWKFTGCSGS